MKFKEAFEEMKSGIPIKLPSWAGYWWWDEESQTILMYTKDGGCLDIRETQNVEYTLQNILSDEWVYADSRNCPILGGEATFSFGEAIKYLKRGFKVARKGWNGKKQYIQLATGISYKTADNEIVNCEHDAIGNKAIAFVGTNIFEAATRYKYRFPFKGMISVEDLWDLKLQDLDSVFKLLNKEKKQSDEESLLQVKSEADQELENKIQIVKFIVQVKQAEAAERLAAKDKKERNQKIMRIIERKQNEALEGKSLEELTAMLEE